MFRGPSSSVTCECHFEDTLGSETRTNVVGDEFWNGVEERCGVRTNAVLRLSRGRALCSSLSQTPGQEREREAGEWHMFAKKESGPTAS